MRRALDEYHVGGIRTNLSLFQMILRFPEFLEGRLDTGLIDRLLAHESQWGVAAGETSREAMDLDHRRAAALAAAFHELSRARSAGGNDSSVGAEASRWKTAGRRQLLRRASPRVKP